MGAGSPFSPAQQRRIEKALSAAGRETGLDFSIFVGDVDGESRAVAERLHAALGDRVPAAVLLLVAPGQHQLEIVTGPEARDRLPDRACALATLSMTTSFSGGDLVGGVVTGLRMLADAARPRPARS